MPDDANGNFSLVSGYLAVTGQTIQPSQHNPPLEDIAPALTARLSRSGVAPMTGPLKTVTGSAATPAIYPNSNPSVGIYFTPTGVAFAGTVAGGRFIGELIPWTLLTAPALTVLPYGQTLLRASYPDLWTVAQTEIAAGNLFYNNGNGTTTFGIGDCRGFVLAGKDNMGGTAANRLTLAVDGTKLGWGSGSQTATLTTANLPPYTPVGTVSNGAITTTLSQPQVVTGSGGLAFGSGSGGGLNSITASSSQAPSTFNGQAQGGTSTPFSVVQPTMVVNFILYAGA